MFSIRCSSHVKSWSLYPAYASKNKSNHEKQVILLMISNGVKWHYLALKKIIRIIKNNNFQTSRWFLLPQLTFTIKSERER